MLAIVVVVVFVAAALAMAALLTTGAKSLLLKEKQTRANFEVIEQAIAAYVAVNKNLPCPANGATLPTNTLAYGLEDRPGGIGAPCNPGNPQTNWVVPWRTLGLSENQSLDPWGHRITYVPSKAPTVPTNDLTTPSAFTSSTLGGLTVANGATSIATNIAFALISHGPDGWGAWPAGGGATQIGLAAIPAGSSELNNTRPNRGGAGTPIQQMPYNTGIPAAVNAFDDVVDYKTRAQVCQMAGITQSVCFTGGLDNGGANGQPASGGGTSLPCPGGPLKCVGVNWVNPNDPTKPAVPGQPAQANVISDITHSICLWYKLPLTWTNRAGPTTFHRLSNYFEFQFPTAPLHEGFTLTVMPGGNPPAGNTCGVPTADHGLLGYVNIPLTVPPAPLPGPLLNKLAMEFDTNSPANAPLVPRDDPRNTLPALPAAQVPHGMEHVAVYATQSAANDNTDHAGAGAGNAAATQVTVGATPNVVNHPPCTANGTTIPALGGNPGGCSYPTSSPANWMTGVTGSLFGGFHNVRLDVQRNCLPGCAPASCGGSGANNVYVRVRAWVDCPSGGLAPCWDLSQDVMPTTGWGGTTAKTINSCIPDPGAAVTTAPATVFDSVYVGFTLPNDGTGVNLRNWLLDTRF